MTNDVQLTNRKIVKVEHLIKPYNKDKTATLYYIHIL